MFLVFFLWPYETISGDQLLYLLNQPETTKNIKCDQPTQYVNVRGVELDRSLVAKSFLVSQGAIGKSSLSAGSSSFRTTGYAVGGNGKTHITEEEKRRFDEEENRESTGDASYIHRQRANQAAQEQGTEYQQSASASWSSSGPAVTYSSRLNQSKYSPERYDGQNSQQRTQSYQSSSSSQQNAVPSVYRAGTFGISGGGVRKIDDFSAEGSVSQDIASGRSRGSAQTFQGAHTSHSSQNSQSSQASQSSGGATG